MNSASLSVAPIMFSHATTARGVDSVRASIALAMTGAMNLRIFGPTAQVTYELIEYWVDTGAESKPRSLGLRRKSL